MSCRSTPGGKAASAAATAISGRSADDASRLIHKIRRELRNNLDYEIRPAQLHEVTEVLHNLLWQVRNDDMLTQARKRRVVNRLDTAVEAYVTRTASLPTNDTVEAWKTLAPRMVELSVREQAATTTATTTTTTTTTTATATTTITTTTTREKPYHRRFQHFNTGTVEATEKLFEARPSQLSPQERDIVFRTWVTKVSDAYGMEQPKFNWDVEADDVGGGYYQVDNHSINMSPEHPSVITLIHETRHALQYKEPGAPIASDDVQVLEADARAWSLSLYYTVRPALFERLVRAGRVLHVNADEL